MPSRSSLMARSHSPRVHIEYEVETYDAKSMVRLPFVVGVLADLAGKAEQPRVPERRFVEIDSDNFDERMKGLSPKVNLRVPNEISGEGELQVEMTFTCMDDFLPASIAQKVEPLRKLLEVRKQLSNLLTYLEGKKGAEELLSRALKDPQLLQALTAKAKLE